MKKNYTAIIIDDEQPARLLIKNFLSPHGNIGLLGEFSDGFSGLKGIQDLKPDLVFLDIQMPRLTGFELLELLEERPAIIFTTAYDQFAVKAFEMNAVDYLLKPFSQERFSEAVNRALERMEHQPEEGKKTENLLSHIRKNSGYLNRIALRAGSSIKLVQVDDIHYLEAMDDYVRIYTSEAKFMKKASMKSFEEQLDPAFFVRVHRSFIVALAQVRQLEPYGKDSYLLLLKSGAKVPVSRSGMQLLKGGLEF